jgi:uncharacterized protein (DUF169 family)
MSSFRKDLDVWIELLNKLNLEIKPVAVGFLTKQPIGIDRLAKNMFFCEMLKTAQQGSHFYADSENHTCDAGLYLIGGPDAPRQYLNGEFGAGLEIFKEPRAARRIYRSIPRIEKGKINYIAFSTLDKLSFEPDILVIVANVNQTEIFLRAMSYTTGRMWSSKWTIVMACAWIFIYPYLTGELNYGITGLGVGMRAKKVLPGGLQIISIPFDLFPSILQNLQDMPWVLPQFQPNGREFYKELCMKLGLNPAP